MYSIIIHLFIPQTLYTSLALRLIAKNKHAAL